MRITKKSSTNLNINNIISKMNKKQEKFQLNNQHENDNKNTKIRRSFLLDKESLMDDERIKVQLQKNNQNKKVYSTKTIDYISLYKKGLNNKSNVNNNKSSYNIQSQSNILSLEANNENNYDINAYNEKNMDKFSDLGNIDRLKKY